MNENIRFAVVDACNNKVLCWKETSNEAVNVARGYAKAYDVTTAVVFLLNRQIRLFRFDGKDTMWFWPGDKNSTIEVAKTLSKNLFVPTIINYAYECGADSEWIKSHCGLLYVA